MHWSQKIPLFNNLRDDFTHGHHQMVTTKIKLIFFVVKDGEAVYSQQKQDLELTVVQIISFSQQKFRLKLKKVGKSTRPARYNLNQIPHEYIVEVINRFKGFNLVNKVPEVLWTEVCNIIQKAADKTIPKKEKSKKASGYMRRS